MTPCYYCEEDADVACRACIHHRDGPEVEQVIAWRAAPPPAADAVSEAMLQAFLRAMHETPAYPNDMTDEQWRAVLDAALAAKGD
jgi:phosphoglycerate dehydrogenase-like enzyme